MPPSIRGWSWTPGAYSNITEEETHVMLTHPRDVFRGQSRSSKTRQDEVPNRLRHSPQCKGAALISIPVALSGRSHLSPYLPFVSVTHYNMDYYCLTDHGGMEG